MALHQVSKTPLKGIIHIKYKYISNFIISQICMILLFKLIIGITLYNLLLLFIFKRKVIKIFFP